MERMTQQRRVLLEQLRATASHPTADELHSLVREQLPRISLGTIYRNLDILAKEGLIHRLDTNSAQHRYDGDMSEHYHVLCRECNQMADVRVAGFKVPEAVVCGDVDFDIDGHNLHFEGICSDCKAKAGGVRSQ